MNPPQQGHYKFRTASLADIELPQEIAPLREIAYNLWWTWNPRARRLFSQIDSGLWAMYRNPVELLINIEPHHWESLLENDSFRETYKSVLREFNAYMGGQDKTWFAKTHPDYQGGPIVYFSTEYGLHESLRVYSGGLGVLSGDHCKSASDLGLPFIAVGLLYRNGYFEQEIEPDGRQQHFYPMYDFSRLPIRPLLDDNGHQMHVKVDFPERAVYARVWLAQVGRVSAILLDTDTNKNLPSDRPITCQLYVSGREMRLCQELILGIGGARALRALGIEPACWHMNEGHSAFLGLERVRRFVKGGMTLNEASAEVAKNSVFTTHTPVPAGNETFDVALVRKYFKRYCDDLGVTLENIVELGQSGAGETPFNLTVLAVRLSSYANGVSELHGKVSSEMWAHLFPKLQPREQPVRAITNGINTLTWLGFHMSELFDRYLTPAWRDNVMDNLFWKRGVAQIPDADLWEAHNEQKQELIRWTRNGVRAQLARHGASPDDLLAVNKLLDPNALTMGFARRFATYKRADLLLRDMERLRRILKNPSQPVQILFAGKAHPADKDGQEFIRRIFEISRHGDLRGHIVFLENYNMRMARLLVQGVDVWLNTPRRPMEASGTSGMKAAVNGALNCSIPDGWWVEGATEENGWTIGNGHRSDDPHAQDQQDSEALYEIIEKQIVPLFYSRDADGLSADWLKKMKASIATITPRFSAARMVREYAEQAYLPAAARAGKVMKEQEVQW